MNKMLGVMIDCSRNAVMNVEEVKRYAQILKKMGYNTLMLYTEDTYEVDNQPFFGYLRGRYSKEELKELDCYCNSIGIELIPCIQTLAHLNGIFIWGNIYGDIQDCDDILFVGEEKTYILIDDMFKTLSECFTTKKIHIGMDEAFNVGRGKYEQKHGICDRFDIINNHLHRVCEIAGKYGFEAMIWSDMFCKLAMNTESQYEIGDISKITEKANLPQNVSLVYWDYVSTDASKYEDMINMNRIFKRTVYYAGGAKSWGNFAADNQLSIDRIKPAIQACNNCNIDGMFFTIWGDNGSECSFWSVLPTLMYAALAAKGIFDMSDIKKCFKEITGCEFDSFMMFDKLNVTGGTHKSYSCKYILYNDMFLGVNDTRVRKEDEEYYKQLADKIKNTKDKGEFEYLFEWYEMLARVLSMKVYLGVRTREAYKNNDIEKLNEVISEYERLIEKLYEYHEIFESLWFKENKPYGFEIQDARIGGLIQRVKSCRKRLIKFVNSEIKCIPELEEILIEEDNGCTWDRFISVNIV